MNPRGGGHVARRLPGEDERFSSGATLVDYQLPESLRPLGTNVVVGAVNCQTGVGPIFPGFFNRSPGLLADGSVGWCASSEAPAHQIGWIAGASATSERLQIRFTGMRSRP